MSNRLTRAAAAKINLYLHVTGQREDGYHLVESLIAFAGIGDSVAVAPGDNLSLSIEGPGAAALSAEHDNIMVRAARHLAAAAEVEPNAALTLTKRLPVSSGIGGGSADAAATLRVLCEFWELDIGEDELRVIGLNLGADVPICLAGHAAKVGGIGDNIGDPVTLPSAWLVIANPGIAVSTAEVFAAWGGISSPPPGDVPGELDRLVEFLAVCDNDLFGSAVELAPKIETVVGELSKLDGIQLARMSGSGATCFALLADENLARNGAKALSLTHPDWWIAAAPLLADTTGWEAPS